MGISESQKKNEFGTNVVSASPRPSGNTTMFTGCGDNGVIGNGNELLFSLEAGDSSQSVDLEFTEVVSVKDGIIHCIEAPFGAYVDVEVVDPTSGVVGRFCQKVFVHGSNRFMLNTEDKSDIAVGLKLRVTVYNSDGTGIKDAAKAFKVTGIVELYRPSTV